MCGDDVHGARESDRLGLKFGARCALVIIGTVRHGIGPTDRHLAEDDGRPGRPSRVASESEGRLMSAAMVWSSSGLALSRSSRVASRGVVSSPRPVSSR